MEDDAKKRKSILKRKLWPAEDSTKYQKEWVFAHRNLEIGSSLILNQSNQLKI